MAYKRKTKPANEVQPINTQRKYEVIVRELRGQVNARKFIGRQGDILEMEPWEAKLLSAYVKEVQ
jgi:hypothetical protein